MKTLIIFALLVSSLSAIASDKLENEIICSKILESGETDNKLTIILQSNATSWVKNVAIYENSYRGLIKLANVQVPLKPQITQFNGGFVPEEILSYRGTGLILEIHQLKTSGLPLNGGTMKISLIENQMETIALTCERVK